MCLCWISYVACVKAPPEPIYKMQSDDGTSIGEIDVDDEQDDPDPDDK